ncbi:hypothetical protein QNN00_10530 [Bacillus velezensis]|nr:hypothetical protein [Bacillus velezensis]
MIADQTLPFFRQGLNESSCKSVAAIIHRQTGTDAVSLTDNERFWRTSARVPTIIFRLKA